MDGWTAVSNLWKVYYFILWCYYDKGHSQGHCGTFQSLHLNKSVIIIHILSVDGLLLMELLYIHLSFSVSVHSSFSLFFSLPCGVCVTLQPSLSPLSFSHALKWWRLRKHVEATDLLRNIYGDNGDSSGEPKKYIKIPLMALCIDF